MDPSEQDGAAGDVASSSSSLAGPSAPLPENATTSGGPASSTANKSKTSNPPGQQPLKRKRAATPDGPAPASNDSNNDTDPRPAGSSSSSSRAPHHAAKKPATKRDSDYSDANGLQRWLTPIDNVEDAFRHMVENANKEIGFDDVITRAGGGAGGGGGGVKVRVGTMCSGTEAPVFAMQMIVDAMNSLRPGEEGGRLLEFEHVFSAEIVPWKQAWCLRNVDATVFRDVQDMGHPGKKVA